MCEMIRSILKRISYTGICLFFVGFSGNPALAQYTTEFTSCSYLNTCGYYALDTTCGPENETSLVSSSNYAENLKTAYRFFLSQNKQDGSRLNEVQAAAIIGNIAVESTGDPMNTQTGYTPDRTKDPGEVSRDSSGNQGGWGLIQWTPSSKLITPGPDGKSLVERSGLADKPIWELDTQLQLTWWHMTNTSPLGLPAIVNGFTQTDLMEAVMYYERTMEGAGVKNYAARYNAAKIALDKYPADQISFAASGSGCQCSVGGDVSASTVVLDPGHSGGAVKTEEVDPGSGLYIGDTVNETERKQAWQVTQKVRSELESKGYTVVLTKKIEDDNVNLLRRAEIANETHAAIAVSIHTNLLRTGENRDYVAHQKLGGFRSNEQGEKTVFQDSVTADKSRAFAGKLVEERQKAEGKAVTIREIVFDARPAQSPGDITIEQLFSKIPWVYSEAGQDSLDLDAYAAGISRGIASAVPLENLVARSKPTGTLAKLAHFLTPRVAAAESSQSCFRGAASGSAIQTALNYAWPTYRPGPYTIFKPPYREAVDAAIRRGDYVGGGTRPGIDCGGFVTRVMQDSGLDRDYNKKNQGNTSAQEKYLSESSKYKLLSTSDPREPGDIAINSSHTYLYVGRGLTGTDENGRSQEFETSVASASISYTGRSWRTPMAGGESPLDNDYRWYRYVGGSGDETI